MLQTLPGALAIPGNLDLTRVEIWLEQQIWGHRFYNDQTPWLLLLEALNLMASRANDQNLGGQVFPGLSNGQHETMKYDTRRAQTLRRLIFTDLGIEEIAAQGGVSDAALWNEWFTRLGPSGESTFGYVRGRFAKFSSFKNAVILLKSCKVEPERNRRFTSFHLAPRGPSMLSGDFGLNKKVNTPNKDRRFFGRGGELLYLMLNRSGLTETLEELVKSRLLSPDSRWNRLAVQLSPKAVEDPVTFENIGYMPVREHDTYKVLAQDWIALLSLKGLPDDNVSEPLMRLSALSVIRFLLERGAEILGEGRPLMPVDAMGPEAAGMRKLARDALARHRDMTRRTVERVVDDFVSSEEWKNAIAEPNPVKATRELAREKLGFSRDLTSSKDSDNGAASSPDELVDVLKDTALSAHNDSLGLILGFYAEQIGLAVRRGATRGYAISDPMLEALVLANVKEPLEFETFLEQLHSRYGFVIGSDVCRRCYSTVSQQQVQANQRHLEERLRMLGLAKRLSDDCAFVINPFWTEARQ